MINNGISKTIDVYEVQSLLLLESLFKYDTIMRHVERKPKVRVILFGTVPVIDAAGLRYLNEFCKMCNDHHIKIILADVSPQVFNAIDEGGLKSLIGTDCIFQDKNTAFKKQKN